MDNVMGLVNNEEQAVQFKEEAIRIMEKGQFPLAKWESNIQLLDENSEKIDTKLLGINWNKQLCMTTWQTMASNGISYWPEVHGVVGSTNA